MQQYKSVGGSRPCLRRRKRHPREGSFELGLRGWMWGLSLNGITPCNFSFCVQWRWDITFDILYWLGIWTLTICIRNDLWYFLDSWWMVLGIYFAFNHFFYFNNHTLTNFLSLRVFFFFNSFSCLELMVVWSNHK